LKSAGAPIFLTQVFGFLPLYVLIVDVRFRPLHQNYELNEWIQLVWTQGKLMDLQMLGEDTSFA